MFLEISLIYYMVHFHINDLFYFRFVILPKAVSLSRRSDHLLVIYIYIALHYNSNYVKRIPINYKGNVTNSDDHIIESA